MPSFLKNIFKSPSNRSNRSTHPRPIPAEYITPNLSPSSSRHNIPTPDLAQLAELLRNELEKGERRRSYHLLHGGSKEETMERLLGVLEDMRRQRDEETVTPFRSLSGDGMSPVERAAKALRRSRKGKEVMRGSSVSNIGAGDQMEMVMEACSGALRRPRSCKDLLVRVLSLLEAQKAELQELQAHGECRGLPTLRTLKEIYMKVQIGLEDVKCRTPDEGEADLDTLVKVIQEGPDYLIDVTIIEAIIWQAEVIDPSFGAELRRILDKAVGEQADLVTFRRAAESIIAISAALPEDVLDDIEGSNAYSAIGDLLKQLQIRVGYNPKSPTLSFPTPHAVVPSIAEYPASSPTSSRTASPIHVNHTHQAYDSAAGLQAQYGTGPLPGLSSVEPPRPPSPDTEEEEEEPEIWEYRGNLLTRSALELVLRQEALATADSSGQYTGDLSWDDVRNAWIPNWAEKLRLEDVAEGELPDTNPAGYVQRRTDVWGNRIGWRDGTMFYYEDPVFELRDGM